jgi:hypothetical protein
MAGVRCLCGRLPFDGSIFLNIVQAIVTGPIPEIDVPVSPEFSRILHKALAKNPDHR